MTKRKLTNLLTLAMTLLALLAFVACGAEISDEKPQGVTWSFDEITGTLTILGNGEMENYLSVYSVSTIHGMTKQKA